jgi:hypothetical protein
MVKCGKSNQMHGTAPLIYFNDLSNVSHVISTN